MSAPQILRSPGDLIGTDRPRFLAPVPEGARIRASGEIIQPDDVKSTIRSSVRISIALDGSEKPACIANIISRYYPET